MSDTPKPALTPEQWAWPHANSLDALRHLDLEYVGPRDVPQVMAYANAALPADSPYKITRADADVVLAVALFTQVNGTYPDASPFDDETLERLERLHGK